MSPRPAKADVASCLGLVIVEGEDYFAASAALQAGNWPAFEHYAAAYNQAAAVAHANGCQ